MMHNVNFLHLDSHLSAKSVNALGMGNNVDDALIRQCVVPGGKSGGVVFLGEAWAGAG